MSKTGLVWFRRDLRIQDNRALYEALHACEKIYCCFVFDTTILNELPDNDRRVKFIYDSVQELNFELKKHGGQLNILLGNPIEVIPDVAKKLNCDVVYCNSDYEPSAIYRDQSIDEILKTYGKNFLSFKDQVIFEKAEVLNQSQAPYTVFTPYYNAWMKKLSSEGTENSLKNYSIQPRPNQILKPANSLGHAFEIDRLRIDAVEPIKTPAGATGAETLVEDFLNRIAHYHNTRDFPAIKGPSYLSVHLRFGTISIRHLVRLAMQHINYQTQLGAEIWLKELVWRDFYFMILANFPHVTKSAFKKQYDLISWETGEESEIQFKKWCDGKTGYPLVDAAMRQLNQSGYMHNRLRMVVASFLVKDLGIDWRRGEAYFALKLNDFDLSANNGGWQWAASSGCDAQPYFRIFNPIKQSEKFDPNGQFIRKYVPELKNLSDKQIHQPWTLTQSILNLAGIKLGDTYPMPIVNHELARQRTLDRYKVVKQT